MNWSTGGQTPEADWLVSIHAQDLKFVANFPPGRSPPARVTGLTYGFVKDRLQECPYFGKRLFGTG
jgi:hypothetical protein